MSEDDVHLKKFQKELSAGTVSLALLAVLARAGEPLYGYLIAKELERVGEGVLSGKQSALYPVLRNLEGAGLLDSFVEPSVSGPPRRYYRATTAGRDARLALRRCGASAPAPRVADVRVAVCRRPRLVVALARGRRAAARPADRRGLSRPVRALRQD